jgi:hypothetical protein
VYSPFVEENTEVLNVSFVDETTQTILAIASGVVVTLYPLFWVIGSGRVGEEGRGKG